MKNCLALRQSSYGQVHPSVADTEQWLCQITRDENYLIEAEHHCRAALSVGRAWYGLDNLSTGPAMRALGVVLTSERKLQEAKPLLQRAFAFQKQQEDPEGLAVAEGSLALNDLESGELAAAEQLYNSSLAIFHKIYATDNNFNIGLTLLHLSEVASQQHDYSLAEARARQALSIFSNVQGPNGSKTALAHVQLGHSLLPQDKYSEAKRESQLGYNLLLKQPGLPSESLNVAKKDMADDDQNLTPAPAKP
jgi:tetratricopeptide (TPR) repeat protein